MDMAVVAKIILRGQGIPLPEPWQVRELAEFLTIPGTLRFWWDLPADDEAALPFDTKREILGTFVERVEVAPATRRGRGFDPSRVKIVWKR